MSAAFNLGASTSKGVRFNRKPIQSVQIASATRNAKFCQALKLHAIDVVNDAAEKGQKYAIPHPGPEPTRSIAKCKWKSARYSAPILRWDRPSRMSTADAAIPKSTLCPTT